MLKKIIIFGAISALFLSGCNSENSELTGQGFLKTKGGSTRSCAGNTVNLVKSDLKSYVATNDEILTLQNNIDVNQNLLESQYELKEKIEKSIVKYGETAKFKEFLENAQKRIDEAEEKHQLMEEEINNLEMKVSTISKKGIMQTTCDSQGNFEFNKLEDGEYYISTRVEWFVGEEKQGGVISKTITLNDGKNKVILTGK